MTAAAGVLTGLAKLKRQDSTRSQHRSVPATCPGSAGAAQEGAPRKRKRRTDVVVVRGRLRLYSASGFFLLMGLLILAAGIAMATLGYWPQSSGQSPPGGGGAKVAGAEESALKNASKSRIVKDRRSGPPAGGALTRFLERHRHSERMKMFGPFTMGIGIFIFICANAILHENRDRETKIIHMRDMYSTVIDIHRLRQKEQKHHSYPRADFQGCGDYGNPLVAVSPRAGGERGTSAEGEALLGDEEAYRRPAGTECSFAGLLAPLYGDRAPPQAADAETGGHRARCIVSSSISAFTLPVIKLNNCVIDEPEMEAITEEERGHGRDDKTSQISGAAASLVVPVPSVAKASKPPHLQRSNSAASSSSSVSSSSLAPSSTSGCWLSPGAGRPDFGSNSSLHVIGSHSKSLDLERQPSMLSVHRQQRKHPSWPRLDRSNSSRSIKGYTRLDDQGDKWQGASGGGGAAAASAQTHLPPAAVVMRDYSKRDKLLMISRSHNNLSFERDDTLKRGSSETRF
ncbi:transmembrane protein 200A [Syngnathoides biaculeatus]|uniref:transmembrane protein 200A n=1 Tax=Syngnathoides biaculeatus TaxID=300417 RepID=UPI002ADE2544|nr:transmembrane protein 200A [Syngnathoides biaculeatus]